MLYPTYSAGHMFFLLEKREKLATTTCFYSSLSPFCAPTAQTISLMEPMAQLRSCLGSKASEPVPYEVDAQDHNKDGQAKAAPTSRAYSPGI